MINSPLLIQGVTIMFCNGFVLSSWAVTVHLSEENPWDASGRSLTHSLSDWGRQILHLMPFLCGKQRFLQHLQSHTADPVSLYASLINFDCFHSVAVKFFSLFFSYHSADKIAQIWTELSTAMETEQYSQEINTASPLLALQPCSQKLEVMAQVSFCSLWAWLLLCLEGESAIGNPTSTTGCTISTSPLRQGASKPKEPCKLMLKQRSLGRNSLTGC